ncbi:MAG: TrbC/VirB2 family protein [Patescibacteria group bacterium]
MKHLVSRLTALLAAPSLFVERAFAALPDNTGGVNGLATETNLVTVISNIITKVLDFILIIAVAYVVYAGIRLIMSGGDESAKDSAKKTIIYVIIGIIVILLARVIVVFVNTLL